MRKRIMAIVLATVMLVGSTMCVNAAPQKMPDGNYFDAEYYAQNNPDVVAVLGNDVNTLYNHYVGAGKAEGRLPYNPSVEIQIEPKEAGQVVYNSGGVRIVNQGLLRSGSYQNRGIMIYAENDTDKEICIQIKDTSVDGEMRFSLFSLTLQPGKVGHHELRFTSLDPGDTIGSVETKFSIITLNNGSFWHADRITTDNIVMPAY